MTCLSFRLPLLLQLICFANLCLLVSCQNNQTTLPQGEWITGNPETQIQTIERQFRGFDHAMVETGYRYQELHWAGEDQNWDYAQYQIEKINLTLKQGFERRPLRQASAETFMTIGLPAVEKAIAAKDTAVFREEMRNLTLQCNACHAMEKVAFFHVALPEKRISPIRKPQ
ncbi:hypothetical protein [Eisenibacter elegans]|uniref:hypothetical protein n=1 Tax=Eisenibacter elegans TaxID=997 RepID=UPI0004096B47|nr:hypothetical protein [Eisenibacter elegans]